MISVRLQNKENAALRKNNIYEFVETPIEKEIIGFKWIYKAKRILKNLKGTRDHRLWYTNPNNFYFGCFNSGWTDSVDDRKSTRRIRVDTLRNRGADDRYFHKATTIGEIHILPRED